MRFLILTATAGNGHNSAAKAIEQAAHAAHHECRTVDVLDYASNLFGKWFQGGYETLVRRNPWMWGHLYRTSDRPLFNYQFQTLMDRVSCRPIAKIVEQEDPDWIICTHSVAQPLLGALRHVRPLRFAVMVTDLHPHRMWLRGQPDLFLVPTETTRAILRRRHPSADVHVVGMPIDAAFSMAPWQPSEPRVLIAAGGIGGGPVADVAKALSKLPARVGVICGRNEALRDKLSADYPNMEIMGQVPITEVARQFSAATMLVSKPGGLTMFEAMAAGVPFLIYWPLVIPGQEEDNARFMADGGFGRIVRNPEQLVSSVNELLSNPGLRMRMSQAGLEQAIPDAAERVIQAVELKDLAMNRQGPVPERRLAPEAG